MPHPQVMQVCLEASQDKQATEDLLVLCVSWGTSGLHGLHLPMGACLLTLTGRLKPANGVGWTSHSWKTSVA